MTLNEKFRSIRLELGMTQKEFAEELGIKRCTVGAYEEHRADIPLKLIPKLVKLGKITRFNLYDFLFN